MRNREALVAPAPAVRPRRGMVLAAGLGARMRPITETIPKPLVRVAGRPLIDYAFDRLIEAGVTDVVVNVHHLAEQIEAHVANRSDLTVTVSPEPQRLETGGGVAKALAHFGDEPFFVHNGDALLLNGPHPALECLADAWDDAIMDACLLVHPVCEAYGYNGNGDFDMDPLGKLSRRGELRQAPYLFTGVQILHPRLFKAGPGGSFSLNILYDRAIAAGRLYGLLHDGKYFHVGTPEDLDSVADYLAKMHSGVRRT